MKNVIIGIAIGIFMMMPGVSGATLAVIFGIYDRLVRDISKPAKYLKEDYKFLFTIAIVGLLGAIICIKGLDFLMKEYEVPLMFFFATAISTQLPDVWKQGNDERIMTRYNILALVIGFMLMLTVFYISMVSFEQEIPQDTFILIIAGIIYGVCIMSPGISGSTVLLALGKGEEVRHPDRFTF